MNVVEVIAAVVSRAEEVLSLAATGLTDKEIAESMCISVRTVEGHWRRLRDQTGRPNRSGVLGFMMSQRLQQVESDLAARNDALRVELDLLKSKATAEQAVVTQSGRLQQELSELYQEVNRLRRDLASSNSLGSIVEKGNVLAYRLCSRQPHNCLFMSDSIRTLGYAPEDFTERELPVSVLIHPEDFANVWSSLLDQFASGQSVRECRYRQVSSRGDIRQVFERSVFEPATEGTPAAIAVLQFDVSHAVDQAAYLG